MDERQWPNRSSSIHGGTKMVKIIDTDGFATRCVHAGVTPEQIHGSVNPPVHLSTTFVQPDVGQPLTTDYTRGGNPTRTPLEAAIADLEGGVRGLSFSSGLAALDTILRTCDVGDHVVCAEDAYGGSIRLLTQIASKQGIDTTFVDTRDIEATKAAMTPKTKWVLLETPTNPLLRVSDIAAVAKITHAGGARLIVDNTFMSPILQRPLELGADVVFHSATKYIGGHSDVLAGLIVTKDEQLGEELFFLQMAIGAVLPPFDCFLLLRGIKTLKLRVEAQSAQAAELASRLVAELGAENVYYPGLATHDGHDVHKRQASMGGAMLSFRTPDAESARKFVRATRIFQLAESLGAVESLIQVPAAMTHAGVPKEMRERTGLTDGIIRVSVGIEDLEDQWQDLKLGLAAIQ
jgi:cystathionine gamma-lyase/homocysteine desulfhydrase